MKFGLKLFLASFATTTFAMLSIGIFLIDSAFKNDIKNETDKTIIAINNIMNAVTYTIGDIDSLSESYFNNKTYFRIYFGDNMAFSNFDIDENIENTLFDDQSNRIVTIIKDKTQYATLKRNDYVIITASDISRAYENRDREIENLIKMELFFSLIVAFVLSIVVNAVTRKIKKLKSSVREIEKGNYEVTIPDLGNDEIGEFALAFSNMASAIDKNVKEIESISESRKIFIGNLTHEIRTPLTSIIGYSSLIKNKNIEDLNTIREYNRKIYEEGKYIESMRDKLMNIMTLETNNIELKETDISIELSNILAEAKDFLKEVTFVEDIALNVTKKIDETLYRSLILNLVKNAAKSKGNPTIKITLNEESIIVEDDGMGIPEKEIEKIKEPFYTLNKNRNRKESGMGLGLTLVYKIVEIHNWKLAIESKLGVGTRITIEIGDTK